LFVQLASGDRSQATVRLYNETHTVGNAVRHMLARNPDAAFVGYSMPHPGEPYLNLRVQTHGAPVEELVKKALANLGDVCDIISEEFEAEMERFSRTQGPAGVKAMSDA
jgi:DNA-directed RNA polymerase I and III subunit RPAC2